jgi:hypothetical protein
MNDQRDLFGVNSVPIGQKVDLITLTLVMHGDVGASVKVSERDDSEPCLLPKSEIRIVAIGGTTQKLGHPKYAIVDIEMPEWLAKDRGLI